MIERRWDAIKRRMPDDRYIIGAEIGVWKGQMSAKLLELMPNLTLYMVDWWKAPPAGHSYFEGSIKIARMSNEQLEEAYQDTIKRIEPYKERAKIYRGESTNIAKIIDGVLFDFIFFDGDHSYKGLTRDLNAWIPKIRKGGWAGGHDWEHPEQGDVKGAVLDFFKEKDIEIDVNRTWFVNL